MSIGKTTIDLLKGPLGYAATALTLVGAVWWLIERIGNKGRDAVRPLAESMGDAYASATMPDSMSLNAGVMLPNNTLVSLDAIVRAGSSLSSGRFTWQGTRYKIIPASWDSNGNYQAMYE